MGQRAARTGCDAAWVADFTYLRCGQGWVYLCAVRDARSRRVLGWAIRGGNQPPTHSVYDSRGLLVL